MRVARAVRIRDLPGERRATYVRHGPRRVSNGPTVIFLSATFKNHHFSRLSSQRRRARPREPSREASRFYFGLHFGPSYKQHAERRTDSLSDLLGWRGSFYIQVIASGFA